MAARHRRGRPETSLTDPLLLLLLLSDKRVSLQRLILLGKQEQLGLVIQL